MKLTEVIGLKALHMLDPEQAHGLAIRALQMGLTPRIKTPTSQRLKTNLAGLNLPNPVGLAAGFDKNATAIDPLLRSGFGFIEVGAVTPRPQPGNPKPRLFRLTEDRAVINRFGFNNDGMNVSSPNTEKLRDLQGKDALTALLNGVMETNTALSKPIPIFLKVAPDLDENQIDDIIAAARGAQINGIFATNTTLARPNLKSPHGPEMGGLSGKPLMEPSTQILKAFAERLNGDIPLVGIGGISSAKDVQAKLDAGATAVQLYSALVYEGISLAARIAHELDKSSKG